MLYYGVSQCAERGDEPGPCRGEVTVMRRVARVVMMLLIGLLPLAASARPFEIVPRSDQVYTYLAVLDHEGLLAGDTTYQAGRSLTRTECAMIVKSTCENVARLSTGSLGRVSDDPRLGQVVNALLGHGARPSDRPGASRSVRPS